MNKASTAPVMLYMHILKLLYIEGPPSLSPSFASAGFSPGCTQKGGGQEMRMRLFDRLMLDLIYIYILASGLFIRAPMLRDAQHI